MKKIIIGAAAAGFITAGFALAAPAQAAPNCVINSTDPDVASDGSICGVPDLQASVDASLANLKNNLSPSIALGNLKNNANVVSGTNNNLSNLAHALTHGVGSDG